MYRGTEKKRSKRQIPILFNLHFSTGCPQKKVAIGPPKPQFLSETFEIFTVRRLFYSGFRTCFRF